MTSRRSFMPRPGRSHISPNTKLGIPAPEYGLSRVGANGRQLMVRKDSSPTASQASGSPGSAAAAASATQVDCPRSRWMRPLLVDHPLNRDAFGPTRVDREMQYHFPHLGDG